MEEKDGYIITGYMSSGDQCYIMTDCHRLGIPYEIYEEPEEESGEDTHLPVPPEDEVQQPDGEQDKPTTGEDRPQADDEAADEIPANENSPGLLALLVKAIIEFLKGVFKV